MRTLRFRIDEFECDSSRIVIHIMRQNKIDYFEYLRSDFDEYAHLIRNKCVFLIKHRFDEFQLMKMMIEMLEMMITMMMIIELMIIKLKMIVICSFEFACLETISRMLFQFSRFESTFNQRSNSSSRFYT